MVARGNVEVTRLGDYVSSRSALVRLFREISPRSLEAIEVRRAGTSLRALITLHGGELRKPLGAGAVTPSQRHEVYVGMLTVMRRLLAQTPRGRERDLLYAVIRSLYGAQQGARTGEAEPDGVASLRPDARARVDHRPTRNL